MARKAKSETVKGLSWKLLYGNYRKRLGSTVWDDAVARVGGPDVVAIDAMDDVPMQPFNGMLHEIDKAVGRGTGSEIDYIAQASVKAWANFNKNLVKQLQGHPEKMMEVFAQEVHPFFLNDASASKLGKRLGPGRGRDGGVEVVLPNGLDAGFKVGLLHGFVALTGAKADVRRLDEAGDRFAVEWVQPAGRRGDRLALLANAMRAPFLTAVIVPVLVGWTVAWGGGFFDPGTAWHWLYLLWALLIAAAVHLGSNTLNDYFDHRSGADEANYTPTPFSGGSRVIQRGLMAPERVLKLALVLYAAGVVLGIGLMAVLVVRETVEAWKLSLLGAAGILIGVLYTAPPVQLSHRGLGEVFLAIAFGPVVVLGTWLVFSGQYAPAAWGVPLMASVPVALLVAAILYVNQFPDKAGDAAVGKRTLTVRLPDGGNLAVFSFLVLGAYAALVVGTAVGLLSPWVLLGLLTLPAALWTLRKVARDHHHPYKLIPANAATILALHLGTGVLMVVGLAVAAMVGA